MIGRRYLIHGMFTAQSGDKTINRSGYTLDWSVYTCLIQLYDCRDMYIVYYIKKTTCFGPFHWPSSG